VLAGVRGDTPGTVLKAFKMIRINEQPLGHMVYATNQCTDAHLLAPLSLPLKAYSCGWLEGDVASVEPQEGGHLVIDLRVGASTLVCMVYEPSGDLRRITKAIERGDRVRLSGGVRRATSMHPPVVNVEKIEVVRLDRSPQTNPICDCGGRMKSEGRGKGYQCRACGKKLLSRPSAPRRERRLELGVYLPSPRAQRHLTQQLVRYGNESSRAYPLVEGWTIPPAGRLAEARHPV
ncbi:MAG: TiaS agmantine-binding domain-containing protein, partial [Nitrososphaerales archaeon]